MNLNGRTMLVESVIAVAAVASSALAVELPADPPFNILKPSTTGVPGEEVRVMTVDPQGNLWIAARWPFWSECAVAMLPPEEQLSMPQPGGGFDTGLWTVWSNVEHPIPSPYIDDIEFIAGSDVMWIASEGGLTRFDRHATTQQQIWQTFNAANSPLILNGVRSIDSDAAGNLWIVNREVNSVLGGLFQFNPSSGVWIHHPMQGGDWDFAPTGLTVGSDGNVYVTHEFATGFSRFDGTSWTYHPGGTSFAGVLQDTQGNLWFGGGIGGLPGLWKWNGTSFQNWSNIDVTGFGLGLDGTLYVSTWYGPVYKMVNGTTPQFFVDAQGLPRSVIQRPNGDIFINNYGSTMALGRVRQYTSQGQLLRRMNTYNCGLPDYFIDTIQSDRAGNVWFGSSEGGLSRMLGSDGSVPTRWRNFGDHNDQAEQYPWAGSEPMLAMYEDDQGYIWMGGNGIGKWNPKSGNIEGFWNYENSSIGSILITKFVQDGSGDIWAASDMWGIFRYRPDLNDWESKTFGPSGNTANHIAGMTRDTDGNLWVATPTGLHFYDGTTWFAIGPFHGSPVEWPTCLVADPQGGIWIGADNGLVRYHNGQWTLYNSENSPLPIDHVVHVDIRPDGLLGMTVANYVTTPVPTAVVLFDGDSQWQTYTADTHPFPHWQFGQVGFDVDGDLWVSTISEGVVEIVLPDAVVMGDATGDGLVNVDDLIAVILSWGVCPASPAPCPGDINDNGVVDVDDLIAVVLNWNS